MSTDPTSLNKTTKLTRSAYGLFNPLPGGKIGGYEADSGLDILADQKPTYAVASGVLVYSEPGHTSWTSGKDTPNSILLKLDAPLKLKSGRVVTHIYYTHLSKLVYSQSTSAKQQRKVSAGEFLGITGLGNNVPHLHIGFLLDNQTAQTSASTYLSYKDIRTVLGSYKEDEILPSK